VSICISLSLQAQVISMIERHAAGKKPLIPLIEMKAR
jgi:hypothetical protein